MDEGTSYFHIFDEQEGSDCSQDNVVQTRAQANKFKTREEPEKEKAKVNTLKRAKQQTIVNQT
jgi:hypothetical protein